MSMQTDLAPYYDAIDGTWPAARMWRDGPWMLRDGAEGGKRVSAATLAADPSGIDLAQAERAMTQIGQEPLFMIRAGESVLDACLQEAGYALIDPVHVYAAPVDQIARDAPPRLSAFDLWPPLAIQNDIWAAGGIGPARLAVMARVRGPKTALFGRHDGRPVATGFVALHHRIAMIHALEVRADFRKQGVGRNLTLQAARWAQAHGADTVAVLCTQANAAANALYSGMGFAHLGGYHYRAVAKETQ